MCLICVEFQKNKMTAGEARRAYREMVTGMDRGHAEEVDAMLRKAEEKDESGTASPPAQKKP